VPAALLANLLPATISERVTNAHSLVPIGGIVGGLIGVIEGDMIGQTVGRTDRPNFDCAIAKRLHHPIDALTNAFGPGRTY
jgi:hypothetical protein